MRGSKTIIQKIHKSAFLLLRKKTFFSSILLALFLFFSSPRPLHATTHLIKNPVIENLLFHLRNPQTDRKLFKTSQEKLGEYLALEVAKELSTKKTSLTTLTGTLTECTILDDKPVLIPVFRAGLPVALGMEKVFTDSEMGFIGMMRDEKTLKPRVDYIAFPPLENKTVILIETMIATGGSVIDAIREVEKYHPKKIVVVGLITAQMGIDTIYSTFGDIPIYTPAIDLKLNEKGYIVPGLGDAGDRAYGVKVNQ